MAARGESFEGPAFGMTVTLWGFLLGVVVGYVIAGVL